MCTVFTLFQLAPLGPHHVYEVLEAIHGRQDLKEDTVRRVAVLHFDTQLRKLFPGDALLLKLRLNP